MIKVKDRDLLTIELLDVNSRESTTNLSKKIHISKQAMITKILNLEKKGFCYFVPIINYFKLGYHNLHLYLKLQGLNKNYYSEKINSLKKIKNIVWLEEFLGEYDLAISIFYYSIKDLHIILEKVYSSFKDSIKKKELHFMSGHIIKNFSFGLIDKKIVIKFMEKGNTISLTKIDKKILDMIKSDGRFNYVTLANKLKISHQQVRYKIRKLEEQEIILQYKSIMNFNKIGYLHYICILDNVPGSSIIDILEELKSYNSIPFISITIENKIIFDFVVKNHEEIKDFLDELKNRYAKIIDEFKILSVKNLIKLDYLIE